MYVYVVCKSASILPSFPFERSMKRSACCQWTRSYIIKLNPIEHKVMPSPVVCVSPSLLSLSVAEVENRLILLLTPVDVFLSFSSSFSFILLLFLHLLIESHPPSILLIRLISQSPTPFLPSFLPSLSLSPSPTLSLLTLHHYPHFLLSYSLLQLLSRVLYFLYLSPSLRYSPSSSFYSIVKLLYQYLYPFIHKYPFSILSLSFALALALTLPLHSLLVSPSPSYSYKHSI